jgi:manganese/iron transport system permease protein
VRLLIDPFQSGFMQRALIEAVLLGVIGGITGVHVVLRRLEFMTDALTHTVFPGMAAAFLLGGSLYVGALVTGVASAILLTLLTRNRRVTSDAALAVLLTGFFSIGVILVSRSTSFTADLSVLLFGRVLAVDTAEIVATAATGAFVLTVLWLLHKELVLRAFDPEAAAALGYPIGRLDLVLNILITLVVVSAVKAVGSVLVIALLITPAATARLLVRRHVGAMMAVAAVVGAIGGWLGLVVSYEGSLNHGWRLASGGTIVLTMTALFAMALFATLAARAWHRRGPGHAHGVHHPLLDPHEPLIDDPFSIGRRRGHPDQPSRPHQPSRPRPPPRPPRPALAPPRALPPLAHPRLRLRHEGRS